MNHVCVMWLRVLYRLYVPLAAVWVLGVALHLFAQLLCYFVPLQPSGVSLSP